MLRATKWRGNLQAQSAPVPWDCHAKGSQYPEWGDIARSLRRRGNPQAQSALVDTLPSIGREGNTSGSGCHAAKRTLPVLLISLSSPGSRRCRLEDIRRGGKAIQDFACPLTSKQISFISSGAFHVIIWTIPLPLAPLGLSMRWDIPCRRRMGCTFG